MNESDRIMIQGPTPKTEYRIFLLEELVEERWIYPLESKEHKQIQFIYVKQTEVMSYKSLFQVIDYKGEAHLIIGAETESSLLSSLMEVMRSKGTDKYRRYSCSYLDGILPELYKKCINDEWRTPFIDDSD